MIQRIQTIYLLVVTILTSLMFVYPFMSMTLLDGRACEFNFNGFSDGYNLIFPVYALAGLVIACGIISLVTIFLFKRRMLQIRLSILNIILFVFMYVVEFGYFFLTKNDLGVDTFSFGISTIFPLVNIILTYLAIRNIGADEIRVKAASGRLR